MNKAQAIALSESKFWESMSHEEIAKFQVVEELLCMPFNVFHEAVEKHLGRSVYTHEFGLDYEGIKSEIFGGRAQPTMDEIISLIPADKRIILLVEEEK